MLVPETTDELFKQISQNNNIKDKNEVHKNALKEYLKYIVLNQQNLDFISKQVLEKYLEGEKLIVDKNNKLKNLVLKKDQFNLNSSSLKYLLLFQKFSKWKRLIKNNVLQEKGNQTFDEKLLSKEELKECTFHPKINQSSSTRNFKNKKTIDNDSDTSVYKRLYSNFKQYNQKKELKKKEKEDFLNKEISFSPKVNKSFKSNSNSISTKNFDERLKYYKERRNKNIEKLEDMMKKDEQEKYTFQPQLNKNRGRSRNKEEIIKKKEEEEEKPKPKKNLDIKRLEQLYSSYKNKKSKIMKIKEEMEKEEGITFKPYINTENSFYTREFNEKKSEILSNVKSERNNNFKSQKSIELQNYNYYNQPKKKIYSSKEREIITQNIINRLYGEGLQQQLLRNNIRPMQYSKANE